MSHSSRPLNSWKLFFKQGLILEHGLNGFDGLNYASLFIRAVTSVVAQVIRSIRSIRGPFTPWSYFHHAYFFPARGIQTVITCKREQKTSLLRLCRAQPLFNEVKWFISVYRLAEDGSLLKEGGVRPSVWALRACSYKTKAEA